MTLLVEAVGPLATIQDLGRPGHADVGVTESGALDRGALRRGNALVGNPAHTPGVEALLGGLVVRAETECLVAVTGTDAPVLRDGSPVDPSHAVPLQVGQCLALGMPSRGLWSYLTVRGGLVTDRVYGSASTDRTGGVGPPPLAPGQLLRVGSAGPGVHTAAGTGPPSCGPPSGPAREPSSPGGLVVLHAVVGPREDWFGPGALEVLRCWPWTVTHDTDRVGTRLHGPALAHARAQELPSEAVLRGSVQVPPSGRPLVFLADHPITGGYPVIAVVDDADTDRLAQRRPGERVRFALRRASWR